MNRDEMITLFKRVKIRKLDANEKCKIVTYNDDNATLQILVNNTQNDTLKTFKELADFLNTHKTFVTLTYTSKNDEFQDNLKLFNYLKDNLSKYECDISHLKEKFLKE